jgi:hypothetical protein
MFQVHLRNILLMDSLMIFKCLTKGLVKLKHNKFTGIVMNLAKLVLVHLKPVALLVTLVLYTMVLNAIVKTN